MKRLILLSAIAMVTGCSMQSTTKSVSVKAIEESNLSYVEAEKIDKFVVKRAEEFKYFNKTILFATQFDKLRITKSTDKDVAESWGDSTWKEMDQICEHLDYFAEKIFREKNEFVPVKQGGVDVLAIQFSLIDYTPYSSRYEDAAGDTVGIQSNSSGVGLVTVRGVLANAKTGELVAMVEDTIEINGRTASYGNLSSMHDSNNKAAQNIAWRNSFRRFVDNLHQELVRLKYAQVVGGN